MAIWVLYTECDSEPTFGGYATSKKLAKEWMLSTLECDYEENFDISDCEIGDDNDSMSITVSDAHYIHAVKLERI